MIQLKTLVLGDIYTNTYLIKDEATGSLAVVDPAVESDRLFALVEELGGDLRLILLTHGHFDHIGGVASLLRKYTDAQVYIGADEVELLNTPSLNGCAWHNLSFDKINVDRALADGEEFTLGESNFKYIATPGHTAGSGCYVVDDYIFSGDTLFCRSIGRTDFPTSNGKDMMLSLMRLADLKGDFAVYPGHDVATTLSDERRFNPYMR